VAAAGARLTPTASACTRWRRWHVTTHHRVRTHEDAMALDDSEIGNPSAEKPRGAGGTPGGLGEFFAGLAMAIGGGYLLLQQVTVSSGYWQLWGYNAFGLSLIPLLIGIGLLFFDGKSKLGWLLTAGGALIILLGIITNLTIFFRPTSLFNTLIMLALLAGGIGLVARSLRTKA